MPMENTSSNSWDVQGLVDNTEQAQQPSSGFDGLAQDIAAEEFTKTQAAARWARRQDPSAYAEAQRLSPGIPPEIAVRQMELLRDNSVMNLYQTVFDRSPQLRNYYANQPKKLAFANPDELDQISGVSWLGAATSDAFNLGALEYMAAQARIRKAQGKPLVGDDALLQRYADEQSRTFGAHGWFQQGATGVARMVPQIMGTAKGAQTGAVVGGAVGAGVGSVVPAIGTGIGGAAGMSAGAIAGAYQSNYDFQRGLLMLDFEKIKDENGQPIDPKVAEFAASVVGAGSAALDVVGMERLARVVPGAKAALGMITKDGMKNALRNPGIRQALTTFARNTLGVSGTEITTEVLQQGLQIMGEASLRSQYSAENDQMDWSNAGQQLLDTAVQTAQVMSILGPFASMTGLGADIRDINNSRQVIKNFNRINDTLADNEFVKRAPAEAANVIDAQLDNRKVALPAQEVVELFQSANADVYGPAIPNWRERLNVALASGGDVEVTIGEYVSYLNTSPVAEPLRTLVRAEPGGYTSGNISEFMNSLDAMIKSDSERAAQMGTPVQQMNGGTSIYASQVEAMRKPLRQMFAQKTADFYVDIIGSYYNAMAERVGQTPDEFYAAHPLSIQLGMQPAIDAVNLLPSDNRGSVQFSEGSALVNLFDKADISTPLHEFSHFFLENLKALSQASPEIAADYDTVKKALGIEGDTITREQHEKFAKMGEAYFYKGKAPSRALERAFAAFKGLLKRLYRNLKNLGGNISPEISEVFDRMLATEEQLDQMAQDTAYAPLFKSAAEMGVSEEDFLKFNGVVDNLRQDARATATEKLLSTIEQRNKGWAKKEFNAFKAQARERLKSLPPYSYRTLMSEGRITIDVEKLRAKYSEAALKKFPASGLRKNGLDPQVAAELLGYPTVDDMVHDFVTAPTLEEAATAAAKEEIKRRYEGNQNESELINAQVQQAMAQDGRVYALGLELQALSKKADKEAPASIAAQAATKLARDIVWSKPVKEINEKLLRANLRRAGSMKFAAAARGDWQAAANWARKQMLAQAMANEAAKVMRTVDRVRTKARKYTKLKSTSVDPAYVEQILAIVGQYEFAKVSNKALAARANLRSFIEKQVADGAVFVGLPERLLRDATTVNYKELSVEDLIAIGDTIDNLEHLGRLKSKLKAKDAAETFSSVKEQLIKSAYQTPVKKRAMKTYAQEEKQRLAKLAEWHASLLKPEQIVKWLDMDNIAGPFMENIFQPIADAQSKQNELSLKYNDKLIKIFDGLDAEYMDEILRVDELNTKMTRQELYAIALNTGTESNRQKLLRGELWNEGQLEAALTKLSEADWKRIQQVWDLLDGLWPEIATMYKRLTGVEPPKVEARGFVNIHGEWRGGYYPVVYDFNARRGMNLLEDTTPESSVGPDKLFENDSFKYVGTNNKYTVKRTEVAKPIKLNLSVLPGHIHTVIHDLAYREPVRAAYKLLWDPEVKRSIEETQGAAVYDQLQHWLQSVASERSIDPDPNSAWISRIRRGTTMYGMGYRLTTALAQPLGFFNSLVKVKAVYLAKGIYEMSKNPIRSSALVQETSAEMRDRFNQMDRDIRENVRKLGQGKTKLDWIRSHAFWLIGMVDKYVANATWIGAYNQAIAKKGLSHELAVRDADSIVRMTQGTGHVKDMPKMMTSSETSKFFTMFYSFFAAQYNMQVDLTRKTSADIRSGEWGRILAERLPQWMYLIVCPAVFGALLSGQTPEEDENWLWWGAKKALFYPLNAVPIVRDISSAAQSGRDYQLTPMGRVFDSGVKAFARLNHWDGGDNWDPNVANALRPIVEVASIIMGLPTGQAVTSLDGLWKGLENDDLKAKDLFVGRQGR